MAREYLPGGDVSFDNVISQILTTTAHSALSGLGNDDHTQYQKESEKGAAGGYVPLNASSIIDSVYLPFSTQLKTTDQTGITSDAYTDVTNTGITILTDSVHAFEFVLICDADATTTGIDVACNGPGSVVYDQLYWISATGRAIAGSIAYDNNTGSTDSCGTSKRLFRVRGIVNTTGGAAPGPIIARIKRESGVGSVNVRAGSYGISWKLL